MGNSTEVAAYLDGLRQENQRSALWLARTAGVPYKRILAEIVHRSSPLKLDTAVAVGDALGAPLGDVIGTARAV